MVRLRLPAFSVVVWLESESAMLTYTIQRMHGINVAVCMSHD